MLNPGGVSVMIGISLLMLGITDPSAWPIVQSAMHHGVLPWVLVAGLGVYYFVLLTRLIIDIWQERAFRE